MDKKTLVKVTNRFNGSVGYSIEDLGVRREFQAGETKELTFEELEKLVFEPGGDYILRNYLAVKDENAIKELLPGITKEEMPEYFYGEDEVKYLLTKGRLDQFKDALDFAPQGVIDMIQEMAVTLPLTDTNKRDAIRDQLGFDVTKAIEIQNTKSGINEDKPTTKVRRAAAVTAGETGVNSATKQGRRVIVKKES